MTSAVSVQLESKELGEQITKLFPKCRPRDLNLNHLHGRNESATAYLQNNNNPYVMDLRKQSSRYGDDVEDIVQEYEDNESGESGCSSSEDEANNDDDDGALDRSCSSEGQVIVLHSNKGATYKLRDSRIIEIAGGRELFSASRSKSLRKATKCAPSDTTAGSENKTPSLLTETVFSSEVHSVKLQRDIEGSVVFDDIEEPNEWSQKIRRDERGSAGSSPSPPSYHQTPSDFFKQVTSSLHDTGQGDGKGIKMIGGIAIAEYEGSPRRYGPRLTEYGSQARPSLPSAQSLLASPSVGISAASSNSTQIKTVTSLNSSEQANGLEAQPSKSTCSSTFDYLYEFSETRKVLEEFFKQSSDSTKHDFHDFDELGYELRRQAGKGSAYVGLRLAKTVAQQDGTALHKTDTMVATNRMENDNDVSLDSASTEDLGDTEVGLQVGHSRNFTLSPETTDCESNCGDLDSEASLLLLENDGAPNAGLERSDVAQQDSLRLYSAMPVLEDGLSSGHASDTDNNNSVVHIKRQLSEMIRCGNQIVPPSSELSSAPNGVIRTKESRSSDIDTAVTPADSLADGRDGTPPPPAPAPHHSDHSVESVEATLKDIRQTLQRTKTLPGKVNVTDMPSSPVWIPRRQGSSSDADQSIKRCRSVTGTGVADDVMEEEEADTDLETDRLLGQQRTDDHGFDEKSGWQTHCRTLIDGSPPVVTSSTPPSHHDTLSPLNELAVSSKPKKEREAGKKKGRNKEVVIHDPSVLIEGVLFRARYLGSTQLVCEGQPTKSTRMMQAEEAVSRIKAEVTNPLVADACSPPATSLPVSVFRLQFLGSSEVEEETGRKRRKRPKKAMVEEAVSKIKAPEGETQPSTEVDLFISTEKIMVLNTDLKEIMMDHALRTISYIADIGELVVLMARRRYVPHDVEDPAKFGRTPKMICHVFESEEAQFIAQSIGQAFQVAYMEFLKANGIEDHSFVKEMDYQEVLNSQEIFGDELQMFAKKEMQKEVVVPKAKGEMLGVVIVESGWGSMLPTVVIANLAPAGAAARCGHLNIGDQIIAINGVSLVGLPLSTCQNYIKNTKNQTVVKLTVVPCAPVVEVKIKRPDTKYQLGFSVQNGVICSLLRGGIAERGGVRVGHRIIEINNQSVVAVPHEKIVNLLATSVGEVHLTYILDLGPAFGDGLLKRKLATIVTDGPSAKK